MNFHWFLIGFFAFPVAVLLIIILLSIAWDGRDVMFDEWCAGKGDSYLKIKSRRVMLNLIAIFCCDK